jgi:acetate---CoA ligase (ADP-forming)
MQNNLSSFFNAKGVALVGASASPSKLSHGILRNLIQYGYAGQIYPVNPKADEILGLQAYADISSVPDPVDLAVIVVPSSAAPGVIEACGQRGIRAAIIISGGFKEVGAEGAALEKVCVAIAQRYGMRLIGPNCVGTMDLYTGLNTTFIQGVPEQGRIGFVSQSGAVGGGVVDYIRNKGVGFSMFASLGNEADVSETDVIEYLGQDDRTTVIAAYVESIRGGSHFIEAASRVTRKKPVVILKARRTTAGARAVSSHTGSLAGSHAAYSAAFQQSGVIEAATTAELFDIALALDYQPLPGGDRVAILTNAGGPAALSSDSLASAGMRLADLSEGTIAALKQKLNPAAQAANPVDMLGGAEPQEYLFALEQVLADPNVDAALAILVPQALVNPAEVARSIGQVSQKSDKPILACFMGEASISEARQVLHEYRVPMYVFPESIGCVFAAMRQYAAWLEKTPAGPVELAGIDRKGAQEAFAQAHPVRQLSEALTRPVFTAYGIPVVPGDAARSAEEAVSIARQIGYPVVLKIISSDLLHKSDAGGIVLNLDSDAAVVAGFNDLMGHISASHPQARLEGALVEKMAPKGVEVIVGMQHDPYFGPLMMFGLGGIYVELFGDVAFRVAPVSRAEALDMIHATQAGRLLTGFRGQPEADVEAVVECILRLSQLALDFPEIQEAEVNPLVVYAKGQGGLALDGRMILTEE